MSKYMITHWKGGEVEYELIERDIKDMLRDYSMDEIVAAGVYILSGIYSRGIDIEKLTESEEK